MMWNVKNDEIFNLHFGSVAGPCISIPCLLQNTSNIHQLHLLKQSTKKKQKIPKIDENPKKLYCITLNSVHRIQG